MFERVYTQAFAVVGAIVEKEGKILLVQEANGMDQGKWNQPAGLLEPGEDPIEAVKREVKEETGYDFKPVAVLGLYSLVRTRLRKKVPAGVPHPLKVVFVGEISNYNRELHDDVTQTAWFAPEEIYAMEQGALRDVDIKDEVRRYFSGVRYPLELLHHTVEA